MVDEITPPITTVARGLCTSEPIPVFSAIGMKPNEATNAVVNTGRSRVSAPFVIASSSVNFSFRNSRIKETITKPFKIAIPDSAMKPTAAEIENGIPLRTKANIPPVKARGIPVKIIIESLKEPNARSSSRDVLLYVSMFTIGHSLTLMGGVLANIQVNAYLIDAIIGLSVVYKGFDNLGGFKHFFGKQPNPKKAVLIFGLFHGFGLAPKINGKKNKHQS